MACKFIYGSSDQPIGVEDKNGNNSTLFNQIYSNPHLNFNEAFEIYQNIYAQELSTEQEPDLVYRVGSEDYNSFSDALNATNSGNIKAGVNIDGKFKEIFSIDADTSLSTFNGMINNLVKSNLIYSETQVDTDGKKLYKPFGNSEQKKAITSDSAYHTIKSVVGKNPVKRTPIGDIYFIEETLGKQPFLDSNNEIQYLSQEEINDKSFRQLERDSADAIGVMASRMYLEDNKAFGNTPAIEEIEIVPENELQRRIKELLQNLGIKTVSLEQYSKKYAEKNGVPPSAQALADISNQIIAFRGGEITQEALTEETAHFIVEASEQTEVENLLRNIHRTREWNEYSENYRDIYNDENLVRREILGKVLANSLQNNFTQTQNTETANSIIGRLQQLIANFFDKINSFFKPLYKTQLEQYTKSVYDNIIAGDFVQKGDFRESKFTLYSLNRIPAEYNSYQRALDQLTYQQAQLSKKNSAPASQRLIKEAKVEIENAIEKLETDIEQVSKMKALTYISQLAKDQIEYVERVVNDNAKQGRHLAQEEEAVYQNFVKRLQPLLAEISDKLSTKNPQEKAIKERIDSALLKSTQLKGKINQNTNASIERLINRIVIAQNMTPQTEERFRAETQKVLEAANKDTGWFQAYLGQLNHAQNPLLNLAGDVIQRMVTDSRAYFLQPTRALSNKMREIGFDISKLNVLIDKDGYIHNETDQAKLEAIELNDKTSLYNSVTGENISTKKFNEDLVNNLSIEDRNLYYNQLSEIQKSRRESYFSQEYLDKLNNASVTIDGQSIQKQDLPLSALQYDNEFRSLMTQIRVNNNGINTESDKIQIQELKRQRQVDSNINYADGSIKKGLIEEYNEDLGTYIVKIDFSAYDSMSDADIREAERVYGLQMIDLINRKFYEGTERPQGLPENFISELNKLETEQEKWEFVQLNAYIGFKRDFWDNFGQNSSLSDRLREEGSEEALTLIEDIRGQQRIITNILKSYRIFNQPSETDVMAMQLEQKNAIRDASIELERLYSQARTLLPESEEVSEPYSETTANEAFRRDLQDFNITGTNATIDYILKHVTPSNKSRIEKAQKLAEKLKREGETEIDKNLLDVFNEDMTEQEIDSALMSYAESRLLPYYKRTAPIGYSTALEEFQQGVANNTEGAVETFITENEYLDTSPSYSFYNQSEVINPKWVENRDNKRPQYTEEFKRQIRNEDYFNRYGIDSNGNATINLQEFQARQALLEYQDITIENLGRTGRQNRYLIPQMHKGTAERFISSLNTSSISESIKDMLNFRQDEDALGQDSYGNPVTSSNSILSIPTYGARKLENQADVTRDLWHSYTWMNQQSALHRARKENIQDMYSLEDALLNGDYAGKKAEATNAFKMFKHNLDLNFYGVRESFSYEIDVLGRKVNLGKLARVFNSYVRMISLSGVTVPLTSLLQGKVQRFVESRVGEVINPIALSEADKDFNKYGAEAAAEIGGITSNAVLNVIGETYGVYNLVTERFENSIYNRGTRLALNWNSGMHALGNFPVIPKIFMGVLNDYRYTDGKLLSYNQYLDRNKERSRKEAQTEWKKLPKFRDDISVKNGQVVFNEESIGEKLNLNSEQVQEFIIRQNQTMTSRISAAIQDIDTQIPAHQKSIAATDARFNLFLNFLNYLILGVQQRAKSYHYDIERQTYKEGQWITLFNLLNNVVKSPKQVKSLWREAMSDDAKKRNLKRAGIEMGVANALIIMAVALAGYTDDEEDVLYPIAFADYFLTRVAVEQTSGTLGLPRQFGEVLESPLSSLDRFYDIFNIDNLFSDEVITRGTYAGETERWKFLSQNAPIFKDYHRLSDPKRTADTYRYFNEKVYDWAVLSNFIQEEEE